MAIIDDIRDDKKDATVLGTTIETLSAKHGKFRILVAVVKAIFSLGHAANWWSRKDGIR